MCSLTRYPMRIFPAVSGKGRTRRTLFLMTGHLVFVGAPRKHTYWGQSLLA